MSPAAPSRPSIAPSRVTPRRPTRRPRSCARVEVARLDRLLMGVWPRAKKGDEHAARVALQISKRRSELLGIDRKPRPEPGDGELARLAATRELTSREIAGAMDDTPGRYRAGTIDAEQAQPRAGSAAGHAARHRADHPRGEA